ncbi:MAG TPA: PQQ-dependent sugar dehydrogenase [Gaiellales bacterium]|nr:PQQ-dependent sugar dehydrogenase [Gaiellales bacterium]
MAASLRAVCVVIVLLGAACAGQSADTTVSIPPPPPPSSPPQPPRPPAAGVRLVTVASGLDSPVDVAGIPGTAKLAVVEKSGRVLVLTDGNPAPTPLLDLRGKVSEGSEQGLLSIAFSPRYARNRLAFVDYTDLDGNTHVAELDTRSGSLRTILFVHQPFANHNGGALAFGPDGMLYVGMGDGGSEGDPEGNGQNRASLLGKILRLNVAKRRPRPRMYLYGLRNPWRFSFDPATGDLWIGDVGQNRYEEVDHLPAGTRPGANLGWNAYEGRAVFKRQPIDRSRLVWPVAVYPHTEGCSITGGYVYDGSDVPALRGRYVYGDFCSGRIWSLSAGGGRPRLLAVPRLEGLSSFGLDTRGELYATTLGGRVLRFAPARA